MTDAPNSAPAKISARVVRGDGLRLPANICVMGHPRMMRIVLMLCTPNATGAARFHRGPNTADPVKPGALHVQAMELLHLATVGTASYG